MEIASGHLFEGFVSKLLFFGLEKGDSAFRLFDVCVCVTQCQKKENRLEDVIETSAVSIEENNKGPPSSNVPRKLLETHGIWIP